MITRTDVAASLEAQARVGFVSGQSSYIPTRDKFVQTVPSEGSFEVYTDMFTPPMPSNIPLRGLMGYTGDDKRTGAPKIGGLNDGGSVRVVDSGENSLIIYNNDWPIAIGVTHNAINDNKVGNLTQWGQSIGMRFEQHKDFICFSALNQGDTTVWGVGPDKLSLFNDAHVTPGAPYQTPQDNLFDLALDLTNYDIAYSAGSEFLDENGHPCGRNHNLLIVSSRLRSAGTQIVGPISPSSSTDINAYSGVTELLVAPGGYFDTTRWCLVDKNVPQKPIILQDREQPNLAIVDDEFAGIRYFIWKARYAIGYGDWRLAVRGGEDA